MKIKEFITTTKAAQEISFAVRTIQKYCQEGSIKSKRFGKQYMIEREVWEEWKARNIRDAS